ncbi:MAG: LPS export ABC transporter periplasmic protein LptC [Catalinimonas sp.]
MMKRLLLSLLLLTACDGEDSRQVLAERQLYEGPTAEIEDVETLYSDSARLELRLTAPLQQEFNNGDRLFPDGVYVEFYNEAEVLESTLRADWGRLESSTSLYTGRGDVVVHNLLKEETLKTEELFWDQKEARIYTEKFVRIETPTEVLTGNGLTAAQDFSSYKILNPKGTFPIQE